MSFDNDRQEIADALDSVAGVKGYKHRPATPRPGDAWTWLSSLELQDGLVWRPTWSVVVFLPQDERGASVWMDAHFLPIVTALRVPAFPESADAGLMQTSGGDQFLLLITMRSE